MKLTALIKTPYGIVMPMVAYAATVAASITAGAAIMSIKFSYPEWIWIPFFLVSWVAATISTRFSATPSSEGAWVIQNKKAFTLAGIGALILTVIFAAALIFN
ncbi:hypothetical protein ACFLIN_05150 [Corynebacterium kutscheri]|uniref:Uncharacterized protein n=1 Tax=Corynebacterium kutscheri TaxID=35755 RepID=A0A0F6QYT2_9CORY|nr:hypothetical protein [Corynebacterium kutscheri]AKE40335.1 hypothetical protein UL82_00480 [Corynebacterium kutscheri]VEH05410.1 Uncharacterised protein [Corynebacterium kutscheri]VEH10729.1 Uncharacterised protein [Corynebacterium kutscheri]